jgi:hypothetical protein
MVCRGERNDGANGVTFRPIAIIGLGTGRTDFKVCRFNRQKQAAMEPVARRSATAIVSRHPPIYGSLSRIRPGLIPSASQIWTNSVTSRRRSPPSYLATKLSCRCRRSASACWVRPAFSRAPISRVRSSFWVGVRSPFVTVYWGLPCEGFQCLEGKIRASDENKHRVGNVQKLTAPVLVDIERNSSVLIGRSNIPRVVWTLRRYPDFSYWT